MSTDTMGWNGPRRNNEGGFGLLLNELRRLKERMAAVERGAPLKAAGIGVTEGGMTVNSSLGVTGDLDVTGSAEFSGDLDVTGALDVTGPATIGGTTTITGATDITGDLDVSGDLAVLGNFSLPNGSIQDDWLANPVQVIAATTVTAGTWTVSTSFAAKASTTIAVPAGFTKASVVCWASMHFQDSAPNAGYVRATIDGSSGGQMGGLANLNIGCTAMYTRNLTGLSGGSISLQAQVMAAAASSATTGRIAQISGMAIFTR